MTAWTSDEIRKIGAAEELQIASVRRDGRLRNRVTIWVVRHGDDLYVPSVNGSTGTTPASTTRSTPRTAPSTAATPQASSAAS